MLTPTRHNACDKNPQQISSEQKISLPRTGNNTKQQLNRAITCLEFSTCESNHMQIDVIAIIYYKGSTFLTAAFKVEFHFFLFSLLI